MALKKEKNPDKQSLGSARKGRRVWKVLLWLFVLGLAGILFVGGAVFGYVSAIVKDDPVRSRTAIEEQISNSNVTGFVYFRDGTPIGQLLSEGDRRPVDYKEIPSIVIDAVLAIEDNHFYEHIGVDMKGTLRAVKERLLNESVQTGGSTLTQQLARRVFLNLDRTDNRKVKEMLLALRLERFLSKEEIITAYLNKVPFGNGSSGYNVYGIKAAARGIFGITDLKKLNIAECAYLAGLPQLPSAYSAFNGKGNFNEDAFKRAIKRQQLVLQRMLEENKITQAQYEEALAFDIKGALAPKAKKAYENYPYLMFETERQGAQIIAMLNNPTLKKSDLSKKENSQLLQDARQQLMTGGYQIYTTIDKKVYAAMHKVSDNPDNFSPTSKAKGLEQVAGIMIDHKTGAILGMIEGRDFYTEEMNYATQMVRQPGSTMKPIAAYLPALEEGLIQPASIIDDSPVILRNYHIPVNSSGGYKGLVTARTALNESRNIPALKLFNDKVGIEKAWAFAKKLGITTIQDEDYQAQTGVLGGLRYGVTVEELTNAYGSIANAGVFNDSYMIEKIVDPKGNVVYQHTPEPKRVFSKQTAYLMTDMLRTVISESGSTGHSIASDFKKYGQIPAVGKTGTTQNYADVWFEGYTPDVTLGIWIGYTEQVNTLTSDGKKRARKIWAKVMNEVTSSVPERFTTTSFKKPDGIVKKTVSGFSGLLPTALTQQAGKLNTDIFNVKYVPTKSDNVLVRAKYVTYNGVNYIPREGTPNDMVREKIVMRRDKPIKELIDDLQKAFSKMRGGHRDISYYIPRDAREDAPTKVDPRQDDGQAPSSPSNVSISASGGKATISFAKNGEKDVVGYRLYRSVNGSAFKHTESLLTGEGTKFGVSSASGSGYSYYVTAVDVAGKESAPSAVVSVDGSGTSAAPGTPDSKDPTGSGASLGDSTAPSTPEGLHGKLSDTGVVLTWSSNASDEMITGYNIYFSSNDGNYTLVGTSRTPKYEYSAATISGYFRVSAVSALGESGLSPSIRVEKS
ncbi:carboxypeptidase [Paenibacillus sp. CAA11]|uniref:transglycosylase domain-containing protein n=1 Tax=Paenibacillus sp. CAA11 TaxID=1532905 RepID=UPI000D3D19CE|nr:transglycosylase domain-containing protein [Paenibacillus sp. CAA11]AWB45193.1 carboxypeptidase [Paenibacillus sp. CAA11]